MTWRTHEAGLLRYKATHGIVAPVYPTPRHTFVDRHYTDLVLVAVVALCTQENDVIHAGYLALALLYFRRRDALRTERNRCL